MFTNILNTLYKRSTSKQNLQDIRELSCEIAWITDQALRIRYKTVQAHFNDYKKSEQFKPENGESENYFTPEKISQLINLFKCNTCLRAEFICAYVEQTFSVKFTTSAMIKWLTKNNFSYKKIKETPARVDLKKQVGFIKSYEGLLNSLLDGEPVEFLDTVHPAMATKITYGYLTKQDKLITTTASPLRINLLGNTREVVDVIIVA